MAQDVRLRVPDWHDRVRGSTAVVNLLLRATVAARASLLGHAAAQTWCDDTGVRCRRAHLPLVLQSRREGLLLDEQIIQVQGQLQDFAAYIVPMVVKSGYPGPVARAWGDFFTMLSFLLLIKPIRENSKFFVLQFNSLDRPEDRPNALKWIILGNIAPESYC